MSLGESFDQVLTAARTGAEWAWARLYEEMAPAVLGYLRGQRAADPEDLAGEVFVDVVRGLANFEGDERGFRSWMFTIAHHRMLDEARRRGRRISSVSLDEIGEVDVASVEDAEAQAIALLGRAEILTLLDRLSADQRTVVLLRIFGDFSFPEIAEMIGKTEGASKALHHRAMTAIRSELSFEGVTG